MPSGTFCFATQGVQILREDAGPTWPQRRMGAPFFGMGFWDSGEPPAGGEGGWGGVCSGFASCCPAQHPLSPTPGDGFVQAGGQQPPPEASPAQHSDGASNTRGGVSPLSLPSEGFAQQAAPPSLSSGTLDSAISHVPSPEGSHQGPRKVELRADASHAPPRS